MSYFKYKPIHIFAFFIWANFVFMLWAFALELINFDFKNIGIAMLILGISMIASAAASPTKKKTNESE